MNSITWKYVKALKDKNAISVFEKENGITIPKDLRSVIENNNGGRPSLKYYDLKNEPDKEFKSLLSFNKEDVDNIYKFYPLDSSDKSLVPFAIDSAGNFFVLKNEKIGLWNHENDTVTIICNTFTDFLKMLHD